jgi:hypothetical protein
MLVTCAPGVCGQSPPLASLWSAQAFARNGVVDPLAAFNLLLLLAMGHFVADFGLQSDRMATEKCPGQGVVLGWSWWLCAHAAIHGFFVGWLTGVPLLGLAEWLVHGLIDLGKCRRCYRMGVDQGLHLLCKVVWVLVAATCAPLQG